MQHAGRVFSLGVIGMGRYILPTLMTLTPRRPAGTSLVWVALGSARGRPGVASEAALRCAARRGRTLLSHIRIDFGPASRRVASAALIVAAAPRLKRGGAGSCNVIAPRRVPRHGATTVRACTRRAVAVPSPLAWRSRAESCLRARAEGSRARPERSGVTRLRTP